ncbi:PDZ domain-containing protein [Methanosarcina horonobensis]|uniref:PDZ domain-containing protein n=1 Tax=Methanosarcina horonobensis TaxID=418008 RepID=UPI000A8570A6|nr:PDZ domain-containing protein [Methanosarcina horonobensis]
MGTEGKRGKKRLNNKQKGAAAAAIPVPKETKPEPEVTATRTQRARILAAGVMANFCVAFVAFLLFFGPVLGAIAPLSDAMIVGINESSPAQLAGLQKDMVITQVDDTEVTTGMDLLSYLETVEPGDTVRIHASQDNTVSVYELKVPSSPEECFSGVPVGGVVEGSPAEAAGIETGMTMLRLNDTQMRSIASFVNFMEGTEANQTIEVEVLPSANYTGELTENGTAIFDIQLAPHPSDSESGFLGVIYGSSGVLECQMLGMSIWMPQAKFYLEALKQIPSLLTEPVGWIILFGLPIYGLQVRDSAAFQALSHNFTSLLDGQSPSESGFSGLQTPCSGLGG